MEVVWLQALALEWWIPAACDLLAPSAVVGVAALLRRPARPLTVRAESDFEAIRVGAYHAIRTGQNFFTNSRTILIALAS